MAQLIYPKLYNYLQPNKQILKFKNPQNAENMLTICTDFFINAKMLERHEIGMFDSMRWLSVYKPDLQEFSHLRVMLEVFEGSCIGCIDHYSEGTEYIDRIINRMYIDTIENVDEYVQRYLNYDLTDKDCPFE